MVERGGKEQQTQGRGLESVALYGFDLISSSCKLQNLEVLQKRSKLDQIPGKAEAVFLPNGGVIKKIKHGLEGESGMIRLLACLLACY
jgi:hypothetical protein